jgi:hypothetical protein
MAHRPDRRVTGRYGSLIRSGPSFVLLILSTVLSIFQVVLKTAAKAIHSKLSRAAGPGGCDPEFVSEHGAGTGLVRGP